MKKIDSRHYFDATEYHEKPPTYLYLKDQIHLENGENSSIEYDREKRALILHQERIYPHSEKGGIMTIAFEDTIYFNSSEQLQEFAKRLSEQALIWKENEIEV
jgi:hypothetical protein